MEVWWVFTVSLVNNSRIIAWWPLAQHFIVLWWEVDLEAPFIYNSLLCLYFLSMHDVATLSVAVHYNRSYTHLVDCSSTISLMTASHPCTIYLSCKCNMTDSQLLLYHFSSSTTIIQGSRSIRKAVLPDSWRCVIFMTWFWWLQWKDSENNELLSIPLRKGSPWICIALCIKLGHHGLRSQPGAVECERTTCIRWEKFLWNKEYD